ncbi:MAG: undecaprenyl-phosphate galactose phosphotransferase WbaP [Longimonas sp.]|uniref:undecaprenyl-phosphate galactose phosphotransferase WbaP n=1 Tax=Longimonas sp. TaxID=2039626 RepID=UPI00335025CF
MDTKSLQKSLLFQPAVQDISVRVNEVPDTKTARSTYVKPARWRTTAWLVAGDTLAVAFVLYVVHVMSLWVSPSFASTVLASAPLIVGSILVLYTATGFYRMAVMHPVEELRSLTAVLAGVAIASPMLVYLATDQVAASIITAAGAIFAMVALPLARIITRIIGGYLPWWGIPAVVVGGSEETRQVVDTLRRWPEIGLRPVPVCTAAGLFNGSSGASPEALRWANQHGVPYAVLVENGMEPEQQTRRLAHYSQFFEHVFCVPATQGRAAAWATTPTCKGLHGFGVRHFQHQPGARMVKRALDIAGAAILLFMLLPVFAVIAAAIKWTSAGPVFYRQTRMGYKGETFTLVKFRTMYTDADMRLEELLERDPQARTEYECYHKLQHDPRVTDVGKWLRRYSLDELPQLLNVIRGDMSLVGPRAYMPKELFEMRGLGRVVLQTPPGITGLWQVSGRNNVSFSGRVDLDVHYVHNWSPWLDLYLLARTLPVVLLGKGAH